MARSISIKKLDATVENAFEFEYVDENGVETGIFLSVYGDQQERVSKAVQAMIDADRTKEAQRELQMRTGGNRNKVFIKPIAEDKEFGYRAAALRLAGWRTIGQTQGLTPEQLERFTAIEEPYSEELGLQLMSSNQHMQMSVMQEAAKITNFIKTSLPNSSTTPKVSGVSQDKSAKET